MYSASADVSVSDSAERKKGCSVAGHAASPRLCAAAPLEAAMASMSAPANLTSCIAPRLALQSPPSLKLVLLNNATRGG